MFGDWLKTTTTSSGTGNIVLTPIANFPDPSKYFTDGAIVAYAILDSNGAPVENGLGTWTAASATLARTFVKSTYVGGTLVNSGTTVTAATLSGGTYTVLVTDISGVNAPAMRGHNAPSGGYASVQAAPDGVTQGSGSATANKVYAIPYQHRTMKRIKGISVYTGSVSGNLAFGIYRLNNTGYPDKLLVNSGSIAVTSTRTIYTLPSPIWLPPDWYGVAVAVDNATASFGTVGTSGSCFSSPFGVDSTGLGAFLTLTQANITLPDPFTAGAAGVNNPAAPRVNIDLQN